VIEPCCRPAIAGIALFDHARHHTTPKAEARAAFRRTVARRGALARIDAHWSHPSRPKRSSSPPMPHVPLRPDPTSALKPSNPIALRPTRRTRDRFGCGESAPSRPRIRTGVMTPSNSPRNSEDDRYPSVSDPPTDRFRADALEDGLQRERAAIAPPRAGCVPERRLSSLQFTRGLHRIAARERPGDGADLAPAAPFARAVPVARQGEPHLSQVASDRLDLDRSLGRAARGQRRPCVLVGAN